MIERITGVLNEIDSEELCELQKMIDSTLDERRNKAKKDAWSKVVNTIKEYTSTFGSIEVEIDDGIVCLNSLSEFDKIGKIVCTEDW